MQTIALVERSIGRVRRRLVFQQILESVSTFASVGLACGLVWFLAEPWLIDSPPEWLRWTVLGVTSSLGILAALVWSILRTPSRETAALELDKRFDLRERVTTVLTLRPEERSTPAGHAVMNDAHSHVSKIIVAEKFPVRPGRFAAGVPVLLCGVALAYFFYQPDVSGAAESETAIAEAKKKDPEKRADAETVKKPTQPFTKQKANDEMDRKKSKELEKLEENLDKLMDKWNKTPAETEEKKREKVTELTAMEEKVQKFKEQEFQKLKEIEKQLQQLDRMQKEKEFPDGPAKEFKEALAKGDLKAAIKQVDELQKKAKDKKLDAQDLKKLDAQMKEMKKQTEKVAKNQEQQDALQKKIDQTKKDGKDAESLERELEKVKQDAKESSEMMERMAERMEKIRQAAQEGKMEELAEEIGKMGGDLKQLENELQDLESSDEYLQRLKEECKKACKACQGGKDGDMLSDGDSDKPWSPFTNPATGKRAENKNAKTNSQDERIRGLFDPRGKKSYGGTVRGPAFTKRSASEMGQDIKQAAQEAPQAIDTQRLPRDAQAAVKEYFEKIGGTDGKK